MDEVETKKLIDDLREKFKGFNAAYKLASEVHKDQKRMDDKPYMTHIDGVIIAVWNKLKGCHGKTVEKYIIVAALHDAYEDHPVECPLSRISLKLEGNVSVTALREILKAIEIISKSEEFPRSYHQYILDCANNGIACEVKIEDLIYNMNDNPARFIGKQSLKDKYELSLYFLENFPCFTAG